MSRGKSSSLALLIAMCAACPSAFADCFVPSTPNDGYFDQTWGGAGFGCVVFAGDNRDSTKDSHLTKLAVAPNYELLMGGDVYSESWWIGELTADGELDATFGDTDSSGRITGCQLHKPNTCPSESNYEFLPQPDNRILIVSDTYLTRTNAGGHALDPSVTIGVGLGLGLGYTYSEYKIATPTGYLFPYFGGALALTSGGKILMAGSVVDADATNGSGYHTPGVGRLNTDLSIDTSFNAVTFNGGKDTYAGGVYVDTGSDAEGHKVLTQSTGKLILISSSGSDYRVSRFNADGSLDNGFGTNGTAIVASVPVTCTNSGFWSYIQYHATILDRADRIILTGACTKNGYPTTVVARLTAEGMLDATFGNSGFYVNSNFGACPNLSVIPHALAIDSAGRILVGGTCDGEFGVQRLRGGGTGAGTLDISFGVAGTGLAHGRFDSTSTIDEVDAMTFDGAGHLLIGGQTRPGGTTYQSAVARLTYDLIYTNNFLAEPDGCQQPNCS